MQVILQTYGIKRKRTAKVNFELQANDDVVFESENGNELGRVINICEKEIDVPDDAFIKIVRKATKEDMEHYEQTKKFEVEAIKKAEQLVKKNNLEMKIVSCESNLEGSKLIFNFVSENRVDFRNLVKEMASAFKSRIELRQIGPRDETKVKGGLGPCGRPCCCKEFLSDFEHSSIKMAKIQGLSLNPTKISGLCGRLMCCLGYENEHYNEINKRMPRINTEVETPNGKGLAIYNDLLAEKVQVKFKNADDTFEIKVFPLSEVKFYRPAKEDKNDG